MTDQYESEAAQRLAEETGEPRERFTADDKPIPELDELEPVTDGGVDQGESETDRVRSDGEVDREKCDHYSCSREPWDNDLCEIHAADPDNPGEFL